MGLERENADHGLVVVAYVSALRGSHACGNPPQSEESDHMINAQAAGMPQDRRHGVSEGRVRGSGEAIRPPWWLIPVLALLVERIRRTADRDAHRVTVLQAPSIRATGAHPHWQVMHHPKRHAGPHRRLLGAGELLLHQPLQPALEVDL